MYENCPSKSLDLMADEELLAQHKSYYASNKRIIKYISGLITTKTEDLSYKHISTIGEEIRRPLLVSLGTLGVIFIFFSLFDWGLFWFITGIIFIGIGIVYKKIDIMIKSVGNDHWRIEDADSVNGKQLLNIIRDKIYGNQT